MKSTYTFAVVAVLLAVACAIPIEYDEEQASDEIQADPSYLGFGKGYGGYGFGKGFGYGYRGYGRKGGFGLYGFGKFYPYY